MAPEARDSISSLRAQIAERDAALAAKEDEVTRLRGDVNALSADVAGARKERDDARAELSDFEGAIARDTVAGRVHVEDEPVGVGAVIAALCEASKLVGPVPKDKTMAEGSQGYKYRSIAGIMAKAQEAFAAVGIVILPHRILGREVEKVPVGTKGAVWNSVLTKYVWRIYHRSGAWIEVETLGEARDGGDKASNKCQTAAYKYAVIAALSLAEGHSDPDDHRPDTVDREEPEGGWPSQGEIDRFLNLKKQFTKDEGKVLVDWLEASGIPNPGKTGEPSRPQLLAVIRKMDEILAGRSKPKPPESGPVEPAAPPADEAAPGPPADEPSVAAPEPATAPEGSQAPETPDPETGSEPLDAGDHPGEPYNSTDGEVQPRLDGSVEPTAAWPLECSECRAEVVAEVGDDCPVCGKGTLQEAPF